MLVLSRKPGEAILIGQDIEVIVLSAEGSQVRVGIRAPREVAVLRRELHDQVRAENRRAAGAGGLGGGDVREVLLQLAERQPPAGDGQPAAAERARLRREAPERGR